MTHRQRTIAGLCLGASLYFSAGLFAQDDADGARPAPARGAAAEEKDAEPVITDPAVLAVLSANPTTPAECFRAAKTLAALDQPKLARQMLAKILAAKPEGATLVEIGEKQGSAPLTTLGGREDLQPEAQEVVAAIFAALKEKARDPARVAGMVAKLADPQGRVEAVAELRKAGSDAVGPLVDALIAAKTEAERQPIRAALVALGSDAAEPLLCLLESAEPTVAAQAIGALGQMNYKPARPFLLRYYLAADADPQVRQASAAALRRMGGAVPGRDEAVKLLAAQARELFEGRASVPREMDGQAERWTVDAAGKLTVKIMPADDLRRTWAARLARDAAALSPTDGALQALARAATLEEAAYLVGRDKPLPMGKDEAGGKAAAWGVAALEDALRLALKTQHPAAATAAAQILGQIGTADEVLSAGAMPSPLVAALKEPDRRLRLAAAEAIVQLNPQRPFAGASYLVPSLSFLAATSGRPKALLAGPNSESLRTYVGALAAEGLLVDTAHSGRELLRLAASSPDYELVMFDVQIDAPAADMLLQQLRHEPRSADLRVGILAHDGWFDLADKVARRDGKAMSFPWAHADKDYQWQVEQLKTIDPRDFVGREERSQQAARALELLAALEKAPPKLFELARAQDAAITAVYNRELGEKAVGLLGLIGTPDSQRALVEAASRNTQPIELRKAAAKAFAANVKRSGILLTTEEIRRQYACYNEAAGLDPGTIGVLASLLDTIEAPTSAVSKPGKQPGKEPGKPIAPPKTEPPAAGGGQ